MKPLTLYQLAQSRGLNPPQPAGGPRCYRIIRYYYRTSKRRTIRSNVTLTEAQGHCSRPDTKDLGVWFDGYDWMPGCKPKD